MANPELKVKMGVEDNLSDALKELNKEIGKTDRETKKSFNNIARVAKQLGTTMAYVGGAITTALTLAVKSTDEGKAALEDIKDSFGRIVKDIGDSITPVFQAIASIVDKLADAFESIPKPLKDVIANLTLFGGAATTIAGSLLLIVGKIPTFIMGLKSIGIYTKVAAAAQWLWNTAIKSNPIGFIVTAVAGLVTGIIALVKWLNNSSNAANDTGKEIEALNDEIQGLVDDWTELKDEWTDSLTAAGKLGVTLKDLENYLVKTGQEAKLTTAIFNQYGDDVNAIANAIGVNLQDVANIQELTNSQMIDNINDFVDTASQRAEDRAEAEKDAIDTIMDAEEELHNRRLDQLDTEYDITVRNIEASLGIVTGVYDDQIDALKDQLDEEERLHQEEEDKAKEAKLREAITNAKTYEERKEAKEKLNEFLAEQERKHWQESINTQIESLEEQKQAAITAAEEQKAIAQSEYETKIQNENDLYDTIVTNLEKQKGQLDAALQEQLNRFQYEQSAFESLLTNKLLSLQDYLNSYNATMSQIAAQSGQSFTPVTVNTGAVQNRTVFFGKSGAVVTSPVVSLIGESGPEAIVPLNKAPGAFSLGDMDLYGGKRITINNTIPSVTINTQYDVDNLMRDLGKATQKSLKGKGLNG